MLLDVRSADEYKNGHLDGAVNAPYTEIHVAVSSLVPDKEQKIIVYCTTGNEAVRQNIRLIIWGYKNVHYSRRN